MRAKLRCRRLIVGITNPGPSWVRMGLRARIGTTPHRHDPASNSFTCLERSLMVRDSLLAEGLDPEDFAIVPFPIHAPGLWHYYVPGGAVHFVRAFSGWEREKVRRLRAEGFAVEVLDPGGEKMISGTDVQRRMGLGLPGEHLVPAATAAVVRRTLAVGSGEVGGGAASAPRSERKEAFDARKRQADCT